MPQSATLRATLSWQEDLGQGQTVRQSQPLSFSLDARQAATRVVLIHDGRAPHSRLRTSRDHAALVRKAEALAHLFETPAAPALSLWPWAYACLLQKTYGRTAMPHHHHHR